MAKDFLHWHTQKSYIDEFKDRPPFYHEREVWFCNLGLNIGHEQDGVGEEFLRPIIIVKKISRKLCLGVPLTTKVKERKYQIIFPFNETRNAALFSQIRVIDTKRLHYKAGTINQSTFVNIKENLRQLFT